MIVAFSQNWAYLACIMKLFAFSLAFALFCNAAGGQSTAKSTATKTPQKLFITFCAEDGFYPPIPDSPVRAKIARIGDVELQAEFGFRDEDGATFWFVRRAKIIFSFKAKDLSAPGVWIAVDPHQNKFALTYSDGGAIGGFHVRVFQIDNDVVTDMSEVVQRAVADFKSRHYCKKRGNNVQALKWIKGDLLLLTDVYPTSDCGPDLGHAEGYRVSVPEGKILEHLTRDQLRRYPGVCLVNDDANLKELPQARRRGVASPIERNESVSVRRSHSAIASAIDPHAVIPRAYLARTISLRFCLPNEQIHREIPRGVYPGPCRGSE
jgi:hypothetical protein